MYNEKSKERTMRHLAKLKEIRFRVKPEEYSEMEDAAQAAGYGSMRQFFLDAIKEKIGNKERAAQADGEKNDTRNYKKRI